MKRFSSLLKPLVFIAQLLLASWLVLYIEKLQPSDFGHNKSLFINERKSMDAKQKEARAILLQFKTGSLDSATAISRINQLLAR